jgi:hypothetical protein
MIASLLFLVVQALKGYLSKPGVGSQTRQAGSGGSPILMRGAPTYSANQQESRTVVETRIKPYYQEVAEKAARTVELRRYRRNQAFGLVLVALAILILGLLRTNPKWIFPPGWWRP